MEKIPCIAMVPCPGISHLIPFVELAKVLVLQHHEFHLTFLIPTFDSPTPTMKAILSSLPPRIDFTILPQVNMEDLPQNIHPATQMKLTVTRSLPFLHEALSSLSSRTHLVALVADLFSADSLDIAKQFNLLFYIFCASGATPLSLCLSLPTLDEIVPSEFKHLPQPLNIPGSIIPYHTRDLPETVLAQRSSETYKSFLHLCQQLSLADGVIVNTFTDLEASAIRALQQKEANNPPVYPVGPIIQTETCSRPQVSECLRWLDTQPRNSVLYVSFGSGGTLSQDQINELAFGFELSGHKFLWAVRVPDQSASATYLAAQKDNPLEYLPSGFLNRTKGQGLVVPSWTPQIEILSHGSTGGFLTHCGWNSTLESVVHSVPLIAWPLFAEQKMNAITLTDVLKVAVRPHVDDETGIVKREEIAKVIKMLMEGDEGLQMRKRIKDLSAAATAALSERGSSKRALSSLALKWQKI